jgi:hypothetical protein
VARDAGREGVVAQRAADGARRPFAERHADVLVGRDFSRGDRSDQVVYRPVVRRDPFSGLGAECLALGARQGVVGVTFFGITIGQSVRERKKSSGASLIYIQSSPSWFREWGSSCVPSATRLPLPVVLRDIRKGRYFLLLNARTPRAYIETRKDQKRAFSLLALW